MASKDEVTLEEMSSYPFASFEADASASDNFAEEVCMHNFNINQKYICYRPCNYDECFKPYQCIFYRNRYSE